MPDEREREREREREDALSYPDRVVRCSTKDCTSRRRDQGLDRARVLGQRLLAVHRIQVPHPDRGVVRGREEPTAENAEVVDGSRVSVQRGEAMERLEVPDVDQVLVGASQQAASAHSNRINTATVHLNRSREKQPRTNERASERRTRMVAVHWKALRMS